MIAQTLESVSLTPIAVPGYTHLVTLRHPHTGDEQILEVNTLTNAFLPVLQEIQYQRAFLGLFGYEIFEVLPLQDAF